jgi:hypothetical protein
MPDLKSSYSVKGHHGIKHQQKACFIRRLFCFMQPGSTANFLFHIYCFYGNSLMTGGRLPAVDLPHHAEGGGIRLIQKHKD